MFSLDQQVASYRRQIFSHKYALMIKQRLLDVEEKQIQPLVP